METLDDKQVCWTRFIDFSQGFLDIKMCDDVFEDEGMSGARAEIDLMAKEFEKMTTGLEQNGFRDGFIQGKDESMQRGFDDGFSESFANFHAVNLIKGLTLGILMSAAEGESTLSDETRANLEYIFLSLEDMEVTLSDPERIKGCGGTVSLTNVFDSLKEQLLSVVTMTSSSQVDLENKIRSCPSLKFSSLEKCLQDQQLFPTTS